MRLSSPLLLYYFSLMIFTFILSLLFYKLSSGFTTLLFIKLTYTFILTVQRKTSVLVNFFHNLHFSITEHTFFTIFMSITSIPLSSPLILYNFSYIVFIIYISN